MENTGTTATRESRIPKVLRLADEQGHLILEVNGKIRKITVRLIGESTDKLASTPAKDTPPTPDASIITTMEVQALANIACLQAALYTLGRLEAEIGGD